MALGLDEPNDALCRSGQALLTWGKLAGFRDLRMQASLWPVRAAALGRVDRCEETSRLREQALAAARRTDAPGSPRLNEPGYLGL